jgi:hypothetical protein
MKRLLLSALFVLTAAVAHGQYNYLVTPRHLRDSNPHSERDTELFSRLHRGFSQEPVARYTYLTAVWRAFSIEESGGRYFIVSNGFPSRESRRVVSSRREISPELYAAIRDMFVEIGERINKPPVREKTVFDGVTKLYAMTDRDGVVRIGETSAPLGSLREADEICLKLYAFGARRVGNVLPEGGPLVMTVYTDRWAKRQAFRKKIRESRFSQEEMTERVRLLTERLK